MEPSTPSEFKPNEVGHKHNEQSNSHTSDSEMGMQEGDCRNHNHNHVHSSHPEVLIGASALVFVVISYKCRKRIANVLSKKNLVGGTGVGGAFLFGHTVLESLGVPHGIAEEAALLASSTLGTILFAPRTFVAHIQLECRKGVESVTQYIKNALCRDSGKSN